MPATYFKQSSEESLGIINPWILLRCDRLGTEGLKSYPDVGRKFNKEVPTERKRSNLVWG
jgi:hypothetical protein